MALKPALVLALTVAFYCHKKVSCNELQQEFSIRHATGDKAFPDETWKNSRTRRDVNNEEITDTEILNKTSVEDYLKVIAKAIPVMRGHVESINGKLYFPRKFSFYDPENGKPDFGGKDTAGGSGDGTELQKSFEGTSRFRENSNSEEMWNKNTMYDFRNYEGNTNENPVKLSMPLPPFFHNNPETDGNDKVGPHLHSDIYKTIENPDVNANIRDKIINVNDFEIRNQVSKESGTNCDDYCFNKFFGYVPQLPLSSCQSHFIPKPLIINFNSECSAHRKHHLKNKPHHKDGPWNAMF